MPLTDYSVNKVKLWAVIGGVDIEVSRVELSYYLNGIATATLQCAVGRNVRTLIASAAHGTVDELVQNVPVTVACEAFEAANSGVSGGIWPSGPFIVFDGRATGYGWRKARDGTATLVINCRNFLVDMEYSWAINYITHPLNVGNFHQLAGLEMGQGPHFTIATLAGNFFTSAKIREDYWALSLQPWFTLLCNQRQVYFNQAIDQGNNDALNALVRFEPFTKGGYKFGVPMEMNPFPILATEPGIMSVITDASNTTFQAFNGSTMWDNLTSVFGSQYVFTTVPMAERAIVAPVIPGLKSIWTTIDPDEYDSVSLQGFLPRPLRGVVCSTGMNSMTGAFGMMRGRPLDIAQYGGIFENTNMGEGMIFFRDTPQWMANSVSQIPWAPFAAAPNGLRDNAFRQGIAAPLPPFDDPLTLRQKAEPLWDAYARAMYLFEVFKHRRGSITGKIRFDIAPGSSVELVCAEEKFIAQQGITPASQSLFGIVTGVTIMIDSEAVQGYTAIEIGHLRNEIEYQDDNLTTSAHPLWTIPFKGAPIVEQYTKADDPPVVDE